MSSEILSVYTVEEAVDLGYNVISIHFNESTEQQEAQKLRDNWPYPNISCSQFIVQEFEVVD